MPVMLAKYLHFLIYLVAWMEKVKGNGLAGSSQGYISNDSIIIASYPQEVY